MNYFRIFLTVALFLILFSLSFADIPNLINFQGILDSAGNPMANKTVSVEFRIYDADAGGNSLWSETTTVTTDSKGGFTVLLGSSNPIPDSVFVDTLRWLGTKVGTNPEVTPRQKLVSVPYSYRVGTVDGASGGALSGDLSVGGQIGIGTTALTAPLTIQPVAGNEIQFVGGGGANADISAANEFRIGTSNTTPLSLLTNGFFRMTISGAGNVGIGTTSPGSLLEVFYNNSSDVTPAIAINNSTGFQNVFDFKFGGVTQSRIRQANGGAMSLGTVVDNHVNLITNNTNRLTVTNLGKVGIGTTTPDGKLGVSGGDIGVDEGGQNIGSTSYGLRFGGFGSAEFIGSKRSAGGNQFGLDFYTADNTRVSITNSGNVGIGTTSPSEKLHVVGNICYTGSIAACSDLRYKTNLKTIPNALEKVLNLKGTYFNWKKDQYPELNFEDDRQIGFVAQELKEILPEVVSQGTDGFYSIDYGKLTPLLVEAIKEQQKTIQSLEDKLEKLEKKFSRFTRQTSGSEKLGYREEE